jgi:hypothetical protein
MAGHFGYAVAPAFVDRGIDVTRAALEAAAL